MSLKDVNEKIDMNTTEITKLQTDVSALSSDLSSKFDLLMKKLDQYHNNQHSSNKEGGSNTVLSADLTNNESSEGFSSSVNQRDDTLIAPSIDDEKSATKSVVVDSIPSAVIEVGNFSYVELLIFDVDEIDDSLEVDLIPPFFFVEEEDIDPLNGVRLQLENVECLNDLFFLHNKILGTITLVLELHFSLKHLLLVGLGISSKGRLYMHQNFFKEVENSAPSHGNSNSSRVVVCGVLTVGIRFIP
ncbi:uncharacterized protein LOC113310576 isoform X2 [Papaver somniferum]|uniref:uncharacterized protein LOC113310576 isoform X2 n=1 Tax=Papaver somniferum TaxID=3469 RepID=UPI000E701B0D|nr:uncharacterized protein LOC113310576 isoform X2 [Papaver somniferum]